MKYIFTGLSLKGLTLTVDTEKLKASQDKQLSDDFLEVIEEKNEITIGDLKFKYIYTHLVDLSVNPLLDALPVDALVRLTRLERGH